MSSTYRHTQVGALTVIVFGSVIVFLAVLITTAPETLPMAAIVLAIMVIVALLFFRLTVEVTADEIVATFGIGLIHRSIRLTDLRDARVVRNSWWYGWGVRLTPHGWLFAVSGFGAVELEFENGKKFRIGTDEPERLLAAIRDAKPSKRSS